MLKKLFLPFAASCLVLNAFAAPGPITPYQGIYGSPFILAPTPPMGWNSWNWFGKPNINETIAREVIDAMVSSGLRDAGYNYVVIDGGWRDSTLGPNGELRADPVKFPHGMKALADYAHSKGLKFGLHTVPGTHDCGGSAVGGYNHEMVQLQQFIDWGLDFIKLDKCKFKPDDWNEPLLETTYRRWSDLIKKSGKNIILSISAYKYRSWNPEVGQMSRTTGDIMAKVAGGASFDANPRKVFHSVMDIAEINSESAKYARPGYWNDPDMMVTGAQGLSQDQQAIHMALWCIMSSPLILGNDPRFMTAAEKSIIMNKVAIAIDQDPTEQGVRLSKQGDLEIWGKKLKSGKMALLFFNRNSFAKGSIGIDLNKYFKGPVKATNVFTGANMGTVQGMFTQSIVPLTGTFILLEPK